MSSDPQTRSQDPGLFHTIYTTRALRRFKPDPIPDDVLFQLFDAAVRAPSGQNKQDWRWIVITDTAVKAKLQEWAIEAWNCYQPQYAENPALMDDLSRTQRLSLRSVHDLAHNLASVPVLVLVLGLQGAHSTPGGSTFPAVQNLALAAHGLGLGTSIFNLPLGHREELRDMLDIPDNNEIYCLLPVGYPVDRPGVVRRKPVREVVFLERFGGQWPFAADQPDDGWQARWL
jgi:nitroreductase